MSDPQYDAIVADPAWQYRQWSETKHGAASAAYGTVTTDEMAPLVHVAEDA